MMTTAASEAEPVATDDLATLGRWIGRTESATCHLAAATVAALAATLDRDPDDWCRGSLPPGAHWLFLNPVRRAGELGRDGHPARGGFLPPVAAERRMWAGGRLRWHGAIPLDALAERRSTIADVQVKQGKTGRLVFVAVDHAWTVDGRVAIEERHNIVYRQGGRPGAPTPAPAACDAQARWRPDPVMLFRYSALTFNGHRIHYDHPYATAVEGYPGLVVHGPLVATWLMDLARGAAPDRPLADFTYRGLTPAICGRDLETCLARRADGRADLWTRDADGQRTMSAEVGWA
jgi:3-methylfumaryl-CoA hydratase